MSASMASGEKDVPASAAAVMAEADRILTQEVKARLFPQGQEIVLNRAVIRYTDGSSVEIFPDMTERISHADTLHTAIHGLLRRSIELS